MARKKMDRRRATMWVAIGTATALVGGLVGALPLLVSAEKTGIAAHPLSGHFAPPVAASNGPEYKDAHVYKRSRSGTYTVTLGEINTAASAREALQERASWARVGATGIRLTAIATPGSHDRVKKVTLRILSKEETAAAGGQSLL